MKKNICIILFFVFMISCKLKIIKNKELLNNVEVFINGENTTKESVKLKFGQYPSSRGSLVDCIVIFNASEIVFNKIPINYLLNAKELFFFIESEHQYCQKIMFADGGSIIDIGSRENRSDCEYEENKLIIVRASRTNPQE